MTATPAPAAMLQAGPLEQQYRRAGYVDYYVEIDAEVCAEVDCGECGAAKTRYVGLLLPDRDGAIVETLFGTRSTGTYRALSHCDVCGMEVEF